MLHRVSFAIAGLAHSTAFYDAVLATLGYRRVWASDTAAGYGIEDENDLFALKLRAQVQPPPSSFHLAFAAPSRVAVEAFHGAALEHGAKDRGRPGLRPHYGGNYYAAFVDDPDGYWIEAVINRAV